MKHEKVEGLRLFYNCCIGRKRIFCTEFTRPCVKVCRAPRENTLLERFKAASSNKVIVKSPPPSPGAVIEASLTSPGAISGMET